MKFLSKMMDFQRESLIEGQKGRFSSENPVMVAEAPSKEMTDKIIEEIHNSFFNEGDRLLAEAKNHLENLVVDNRAKAEMLDKFGFGKTKEVGKMKEVDAEREKTLKISNAIMEAKKEFPLYKFITEDAAKKIAEKYNLVLGVVSQYKGFVPQKNLEEIERFYKNHPAEKTGYFRSFSNGWRTSQRRISKAEYEIGVSDRMISHNHVGFFEAEIILNICAPLSDMDTQGYTQNGWKLEKEIPDPIVMLPKSYHGVSGFIIITAWGDEASDPEVVNHINN